MPYSASLCAQVPAAVLPEWNAAVSLILLRQPRFYKWRGGGLGPRAQRRERLAAEVARLFGLHDGKYGLPRITTDLRDGGWRVSENTVAALMREQYLAARRKKRRKATTGPGRGRWRAPDLIKRNFPAARINQKWYGDGTEIATGQGKLRDWRGGRCRRCRASRGAHRGPR